MIPIPSTVRTAKIAELTNGTPIIRINFPYNQDDLQRIRTLKDRKFHAEGKFWSSPVSVDNLEMLRTWGFTLDADLSSILNRSKVKLTDVMKVVIPGLRGSLYPYQNIGVSWIENKAGRALIADEMGLGKTVQALAWLQLHPECRLAIIIVPATLKLNWLQECKKWLPNPKVIEVSGTTPYSIGKNEIVVINYDVISHWVEYFKSMKPQVLILDEIHKIKNNAAKRTKAIKSLAKGIPNIIGLSGTPIINRPIEAYNAISLIDPTIVPNYWSYVHRYCGAKNNGFGWDFNGATNTAELHDKLINTIMLRRLKKDVLLDLPDKTYSYVPIELDNRKEYRSAEADFIAYIRATKGVNAAEKASSAATLAEIEGLKQLAVKGKLEQVIEWIKDFLEDEGKLVVFAVHKFVIDRLMLEFGNIAVKIDGSVSMKDRNDAVIAFQNDPKKMLFIGNVQAAGVGLTLTASSNVAFVELPWTPGELAQAEDRCHRIGQKDAVNIHFLLAAGTIEEKIAKLLDSKRKVLDAVIDGKETENKSLLHELMNSLL